MHYINMDHVYLLYLYIIMDQVCGKKHLVKKWKVDMLWLLLGIIMMDLLSVIVGVVIGVTMGILT